MSSSTTVLPILYCQFRGYTTLMSASVLPVDFEPDLTTVVLHCAVPESASGFPRCVTLGIPFTITAGPSTMEYDYTAAVIIPGTSTFYRHGTVDCDFGSGETIRCDETTSDLFGEVPTYTNRTWTTSRTITDRTWLGLTVTGGLDKLPDPTGVITTTTTDEEGDPATVTITLTSTETVTNTSPSETGSDAVSPSETTGSNPDGKGSGGGSSRAWVAGPVLGGLTGVLLVVFVVFWTRRRRRGQKPTGSKVFSNAQRADLEVDNKAEKHELEARGKPEMEAREAAVAELPPAGRSRDSVHEML